MSTNHTDPATRQGTSTGDTGLIPAWVRRNHWMNQVRIHALMAPDEPALKADGHTTTWEQLNARMDSLAAALQRRGLQTGDRVVLLTLNHAEAILGVLGVNRAGGIAVPINARLTPPEIAYIVEDADADTIIVDRALAPLVAGVTGISERLRRIIVVDPGGVAAGDAGQAAAAASAAETTAGAEAGTAAGALEAIGGLPTESFAALAAEDPAGFTAVDVAESTVCLIMYTSGTTGRPKGAMLDHINMFAQAGTTNSGRTDPRQDVVILTAPLFHIAAWGQVAANLVSGAPTIVYPLGGFDPVDLLDTYEREGATVVFNVPQQWQAICQAVARGKPGRPGEVKGEPWRLNLKHLSWGAAPASESVLRAMEETFPDAEVTAAFGQTEMSPVTCSLDAEDSVRKIGSIGKPIPTMAARIVDPAMNDVTPGEVGELVYQGPNLMQGYWRKPEETAKAFTGGWFHSGDLVRADDEGFLYIVDRAKDMIISGGENIYCAEVENVLFDHPAVLEAAVYGRPDERWGEVPIAAVALREGAQLTLDELRTWLDDRLARFKQPKDLVFVDTLPRNASGKVRKVDLRRADAAD
ncbi:long-chain-fatty-acid--CoA ligase [Brevibacterium sp. 91QC2O2]|uniref:long-chain-fatty-acid--CoA ligase n=1 Tax=Brevibacterium sp. 91QC2O2 TaxID=2968458 RepID=UPI00211BF8BA|nr:long-chain-fatty-acid--CoA ligase [Brevibacterium sp. 91QC2O2]MCQ9368525.1 long-chain-fatty-acid--CoA ligase [Brevibacterium sp. 91QC2O2]